MGILTYTKRTVGSSMSGPTRLPAVLDPLAVLSKNPGEPGLNAMRILSILKTTNNLVAYGKRCS
jgi:hypothetical protein